ncbi:histone-lysine N-methyltransferase SETMAR [Trichonephila clavipes]|nr:histone-lysine N-methyltransferase SETMAR [Trichonephila clavipes]
MIAEVNALDNHRIIVDEINRLLGISVGTTHTIMHQYLNFRKICAHWVPHQLTVKQRNPRMALSLSHLQRYHEEENGFLSQIVPKLDGSKPGSVSSLLASSKIELTG